MRRAPEHESQRQLRVGEQMRHVLAELLRQGAVHDPVLAESSLTISEVKVARDLRRAVVFAIQLGGELPDEIVHALDRAAPFLRGEIARRMHLKYAPELIFRADTSFGEAARIERLIEQERASLAHVHERDDGTS